MNKLAQALLDSIVAGRPDPLLGHYDGACVLESYAAGARATSYGTGGVESAWALLIGPPAQVAGCEVMAASDGCEVDALLRRPDGSVVRHLHRIYHDGAGKIGRHVVYPARPRPAHPPGVPARLNIDPTTVAPYPQAGFSGAALFSARTRDGRPVVLKHIGHDDWMRPRRYQDSDILSRDRLLVS